MIDIQFQIILSTVIHFDICKPATGFNMGNAAHPRKLRKLPAAHIDCHRQPILADGDGGLYPSIERFCSSPVYSNSRKETPMKFRSILLTSAAVLFCTASISATTAAHTWVSGNGSNSNPCTFASPCATFSYAITQTTAGGIISAEDAGDFGPVIISQSVTIDGGNLGSITTTFNVNAVWIYNMSTTPINVVVRNLTLNGMSSGDNGVFIAGPANVTIVNCLIENFTSVGVEAYTDAAQNIVIRNSVIVGGVQGFFTSSQGVYPLYASLQDVTIQGVTQAAIYTNIGIVEVTNSVLTQNGSGVIAYSGSTVSVASSMITANISGVCSGASSKVRLDNNDIYDNTTAIANCGGIVKTSTTNKTSGTIAILAADISNSVTF